jgi:signal transduction histidine kinase/DNA-binding response OmpR family regulator
MPTSEIQKKWLNSLLTLTLGITFSVILLFIAWRDSIQSQEREFSLASSTLKDTVARNTQTANDTLNSLSTYLEVNPDLSIEEYSMLTTSVLGLYPFLEGTVYVTHDVDSANPEKPYSVHYQTIKGGNTMLADTELLSDEAYASTIDLLFKNDSVITLASEYNRNNWKGFWILRAVKPVSKLDEDMGNYGFAAILINTNTLVGPSYRDTGPSLILLSDSASLSGRTILHEQQPSNEEGWVVNSLTEESITQFPFYSVRLLLSKELRWSQIEKTMMLISLLIGASVTLLLMSLGKARDEQEKHLRERNAIIEAQVLAQTEELGKARDDALQAALAKSSFLASMSHEIRTPLNAIIGMSELLSETGLDLEQKKYVAVFKKAGDTLLSLVNDILDLSKIEANQLELEKIEFNLIENVEESVEIYALKAAEKSIELLTDIPADMKPVRYGDPSRLKQILLNLISNALKFTERGAIIVRIAYVNPDNTDMLQISVADTGTGIPEDKLEKIFESFSQADSSTTRKYGGTGLGLTISRRLVEMMGGKIWVESELGKGSTFFINVPIPLIMDNDENRLIKTGALYHKILIVDDNQYARQILDTFLSDIGAKTVTKSDSQSALVYLQDDLSRAQLDLLLIDADMPGIDGFTLVNSLKEFCDSIPIIMMVNPATLNQNQKELDDLGLSYSYLPKPIKISELLKMLELALKTDKDIFEKTVPYFRIEDFKKLSILLVDDNSDNRLLVKAYLKKLPYVIDEAENGEEACSLFKSDKYDVVLMDVQMPLMDGREATRAIREWEKMEGKKATPIIALTAHAVKEEIDYCIEAGCDTHLSKPVKKETLISTIKSLTGSSN